MLVPQWSPRLSVCMCVCAAIVAGPSCKKQAADVSTHWLSTTVQIDGHFDDWDAIPESRRHEDHAVLKLASDSEALYIYYVTDDLDWVRTITMTGLTIYLNRNGSHDKEYFICYRGGPPTDELVPATAPGGPPGADPMHPALRDQLLESERENLAAFTCFVRDWIVEKAIPTDGRQGPRAAYGRQNGRFAYEFSIPLQSSLALYYGLGTQPGSVVGIGAEWGGLPRPVLEPEPTPGSADFGGERGAGSEFGEFGSTEDAAAPPGAKPPELPEKEEVWLETQLATPPAPQP